MIQVRWWQMTSRVHQHNSLDDEDDTRRSSLIYWSPTRGHCWALRRHPASHSDADKCNTIWSGLTTAIYFRNRFGLSSFISVSWPDVRSFSKPPSLYLGSPFVGGGDWEKNWNRTFRAPEVSTFEMWKISALNLFSKTKRVLRRIAAGFYLFSKNCFELEGCFVKGNIFTSQSLYSTL